jgi:hypothetical protein
MNLVRTCKNGHILKVTELISQFIYVAKMMLYKMNKFIIVVL